MPTQNLVVVALLRTVQQYKSGAGNFTATFWCTAASCEQRRPHVRRVDHV